MIKRKIEVSKRSTASYYSTAATFALPSLIFTPHSLAGFLVIGAICAAVFLITLKVTKNVTVYKDRPSLGIPELDEALAALGGASELFEKAQPLVFSRSTDASDKLLSIKASTDSIAQNLMSHPEDLKIARKFLNLYLPMVVKMMNNYIELYRQGTQGDNIVSSMEAIEGSLVSIDEAFKRQLDALFANDNLDVATDIDVLNALMGDGGAVK